jgi:hypothetical protein
VVVAVGVVVVDVVVGAKISKGTHLITKFKNSQKIFKFNHSNSLVVVVGVVVMAVVAEDIK